jgi:pimeloyl-ACP methyl ester carboxylesterase
MNDAVPAGVIPGFTSTMATVDGVRLHYWIGGDPKGQPVLLWHGFLSTGHAWRKVAPALANAGLAVIVPDMRGFGDSDKPPGTEGYNARALAEEARALVRQIGFGGGQPITLVAHDMGGPPALLWAANYPDEIAGLLYVEAPVMLSEVLTKIIAYTPEAMERGSMWWWLLPLAPGVPERLVVGNERAFLTWFYEGAAAHPSSIEPAAVDEVLRTFRGTDGVLGAMGVYRAAFTSIAQTAPLTKNKVRVPVVALGGDRGLGAKVGQMVGMVASALAQETIGDCGHFLPEERPEAVVRHVLAMLAKTASQGQQLPATGAAR